MLPSPAVLFICSKPISNFQQRSYGPRDAARRRALGIVKPRRKNQTDCRPLRQAAAHLPPRLSSSTLDSAAYKLRCWSSAISCQRCDFDSDSRLAPLVVDPVSVPAPTDHCYHCCNAPCTHSAQRPCSRRAPRRPFPIVVADSCWEC